MRVPLEWLQEFIPLDMEPQELAKRLTMRGLEVENIEEAEFSFKNVVVGNVLTVEPHPQAERLKVCKVDIGERAIPVVCGAENVQAGKKVPVALIGACLAGGAIIEKKEIKGITSYGMLCSEKELGLSDDQSGIFILNGDARPGDKLETVESLRDTVFEINVPPNRGDCLSIYGIAREVAAIMDKKIELPSFEYVTDGDEGVEHFISLDVKDLDACPRYVLLMIKGIKVNKSPYWMRRRIIKCGMRPINSIVDVTNYVMLELGQPLHAFDYEKLKERRIEVKVADSNLTFRTLDGQERGLIPGDLLICDGHGPVAIAGIMGGENSEIGEDTETVALESAFFNPFFIRSTARRLGIKSEASLRFEKGIDVDTVEYAGKRAIYLMHMLSGGHILDGKKEAFKKEEKKRIFVKYGRINDVLGIILSPEEIGRLLASIDINVVGEEDEGFIVSIPSFRHDINEYMDVIEEVARLHGYEHIPATTPVTSIQPLISSKKDRFLSETRQYLYSAGFYQVINFSFFSRKDLDNFVIPDDDERRKCVMILNPISKELEATRTFIAQGLMKNIAYNLNRGSKNLKLFEIGKIFIEREEGLPLEYHSLALAITGRERDYFWKGSPPEYDFFDLKGVIEGLLRIFNLDVEFRKGTEPFLNGSVSGDIHLGEEKIGWLGEVKEGVLKAYGIEQRVYCGELMFDKVMKMGNLERKYNPIPRYPHVIRDFSFYIDESIPVSKVMGMIKEVSPFIVSVGVFDMFRKERRSISFRVLFQSYEDTLKDEEVNKIQDEIVKRLTAIDGIVLRS